MITSAPAGSGLRTAPLTVLRSRIETMASHHGHEESNLKEGLIGIGIAVVGLAIIMGIAYFLAAH
jgi:hypothetical protein